MRRIRQWIISCTAFMILQMTCNIVTGAGTVSAADSLAPISGMATGKSIILNFNVSLLPMISTTSTSTPVDPSVLIARAASQFIVKINDNYSVPTMASASDKTVALFLSAETAASDIITVTYRPGSAPLKDSVGNSVPSFSDYFVPTTVSEFIPRLTEIKAAGKRVFMFYDKELKTSSVPPISNFLIVNGTTSLRVETVTILSNIVQLELHDFISVGKSLTLRYSPTTTPLMSKDGHPVAPIGTYSIPNAGTDATGNSSGTSTSLKSAALDGKQLMLTFDTELSAAKQPKVGQFFVKAGGSPISVSSLTVSGDQVVLKLAKAVTQGQSVTVSYYATGDSLQGVKGQPINGFTDYAVTSQTAAPGSSSGYLEPDAAGGLKLNGKAWSSVPGTAPSGKSAPVYTVDGDKLADAYDQLKTSNAQVAKAEIGVTVPSTDPAALVRVPVAALIEAQSKISNASFRVDYGDLKYLFPLSAISYSQALNQLEAGASDAYIQFYIEKKSGSSALLSPLYAQGYSVLATPAEFGASLIAGSTQKELTEFQTYVKRTFVVSGNSASDPNQIMVVRYDEATGQLASVPTTTSTADRGTAINFLRKSNSEYAVVRTKPALFGDMTKHWAKADVQVLASKLIVDGTEAGKYSPDQPITRADFAKFIVKGMGLSGDKQAAAVFKDANMNGLEAAYIGAASKAGIVSGGTDGNFRPNETVTREEMASMLLRAMNYANVTQSTSTNTLSKFTDRGRISSYAKTAVAACVDAGIISGVTTNKFSPKENATRAQAASMIKRFLNYVEFLP